MKRPDKPVNEGIGEVPMVDAKWASAHPLIVEHLTHASWDDGTPREVSTITVFVNDGRIKLCLNDREAQCSLYVTADTMQGAFASLEKQLASGPRADWRKWAPKGKGRK